MNWSNAAFHRRMMKNDLLHELTAFSESLAEETGNRGTDPDSLRAACKEKLDQAIHEIRGLRNSLRMERHQTKEAVKRLEEAQKALKVCRDESTEAWLHN